jgi:hypothetical protein
VYVFVYTILNTGHALLNHTHQNRINVGNPMPNAATGVKLRQARVKKYARKKPSAT